ncbi:hypothetical protein ACH5RR_020059 [Cinchona calisaya]|uniref:Uncharacterized protein n=1 Tax=Cinchona calisaya TaxID=153742 RepID=A0ABD2ZGT0_9GENT
MNSGHSLTSTTEPVWLLSYMNLNQQLIIPTILGTTTILSTGLADKCTGQHFEILLRQEIGGERRSPVDALFRWTLMHNATRYMMHIGSIPPFVLPHETKLS